MSPLRSKATARGQISVPAEIRRKLGIDPGTVLEWHEDGEQVIGRHAKAKHAGR
jgi:AbrB family looped-hinge helix DNA binding protein